MLGSINESAHVVNTSSPPKAAAPGEADSVLFDAHSMRISLALTLLCSALLAALGVGGCGRTAARPESVTTPTLRLYVLSTAAGALDPCGCTKDMLGGVDHAAALVAAGAKEAPHSLVVAAGPMLFMDPKSDASRGTQDLWKAEALAAAFGDMKLVAWAPGANDWAMGENELRRLSAAANADLLAGNLRGATAGAKATRFVTVDGHKVGIAGVSEPKTPTFTPDGVQIDDLGAALSRAEAELQAQGAEVRVALVATDRGRALRLAERAPGFHVLVVGKAFDQGEGNDAPVPPVLVGDTLVVQGANHLQGAVIVDLFVRGSLPFRDATGIAAEEKRQSLVTRIADLERRVAEWERAGTSTADVAARKKDLDGLKRELAAMKPPAPPTDGSFFRFRTVEVREALGSDKAVADRMSAYYSRVNEHNREAFKDRLPPAPRAGDATYIGAEACESCHDAAYQFWKTTPHASAYAALSKQHKEFNLDCVSCHVTGYEKPGGTSVTHVKGLTDVQCEVCHGPGSRHEKDPSDPTVLVRSPPKTLCAPACHHPPHVPSDWSVEAAWRVILGKGHGMK